jgi:hypothetical protein
VIEVPYDLLKAQERGLAQYRPAHWWGTVPAGAVLKIYSYPPPSRYLMKLFAVSYGQLDPAGTSPDFVVSHYGRGVLMFQHGWTHSVIQRPLPLTMDITAPEPHIVWLRNDTGETQSYDMILHRFEFTTRDDWDKYRALAEERHSILEELRRMRR